jgi:hypothetical protein
MKMILIVVEIKFKPYSLRCVLLRNVVLLQLVSQFEKMIVKS